MAETNIRYLPEGLRVDGDLIAVDSSLVELPENLYVGGNLDVMGSKVKSLLFQDKMLSCYRTVALKGVENA